MKTLVITVAGTATRFNKDTERTTLKCLYYIEKPQYSLLYQILDKARDMDEFIIVGGYLYEELSMFISKHLSEFLPKIKLVYNPHYMDYGSGYSLIKGIKALSHDCEEVVFVEGDLFFDKCSFERIKYSSKDTLTVNHELITSQKAVVLYVDKHRYVHYLYDTAHSLLKIDEAFQAIYNSAQIWKFLSISKLHFILNTLTDLQIKGTNLEIIQAYFADMPINSLNLVAVDVWHNCNTVSDYQEVYSLLKV